MQRAAEISRQKMLAGEGGPFGAVVVRDDSILGEGWNRVTSTADPTAHAEIVAIRDACSRVGSFTLEGALIYTSCEPCPMCLAAIWWARISRIYYANTRNDAARIGFDDAEIYQEVTRDLTDRRIPLVHCPNQEAVQAMREWTEKQDKIPY
ncbi:MAG TPA: nucleoside deaminase [Gammaproteobacteria bacterium]|nr:MAG: tRNA-specific adenosine deaminase [Acidithiobacillus sp.]HAD36673.1 tRNA-specific adenosine deaminase [Gammaproteobacteria bacterium]PHS07240.1 MAG: tRNA-specific adenosine deaminase [Acidithiobacillus sp.]HBK75399.1 tRNA-specific adenosine deaminase [Gammaproteobacteria bacterium]HIM98937.1 nucleoside deaminase [Gammaproteobacteria bacterium]